MDHQHSQMVMDSLTHHAHMASESIKQAASEYERPCVLFRPKLTIDGDQWCALFGENLMEGVAGFGDTPSKAMWNFDHNWYHQKATNTEDE